MPKPTTLHTFLVQVETEDAIENLKDVITGRLHSKQGFVGFPKAWNVELTGATPREEFVLHITLK